MRQHPSHLEKSGWLVWFRENVFMTAKKLQYFVEHGNISRDRCIQIGKAAEVALVAFSQSRDMNELALAMLHCCAFDPDEAAFFLVAADFCMEEKWGTSTEVNAPIIVGLDQQYAQICNALKPGSAIPISSQRPASSSGGCLILIGFIGIVPLGYCAARLFLA